VERAGEQADRETFRLIVCVTPERGRDAAAPLVIGELTENAADVVGHKLEIEN
jgi:hypothetical protein